VYLPPSPYLEPDFIIRLRPATSKECAVKITDIEVIPIAPKLATRYATRRIDTR